MIRRPERRAWATIAVVSISSLTPGHRGDHHGAAHPLVDALLQRLGQASSPGPRRSRAPRRRGRRAPMRTRRRRPPMVVARVDRVGGPLAVRRDASCHSARPTDAGSSDAPMTAIDGREQHPRHRPRVRALLAALDRVDEVGRVGEGEVDVDHARLEPAVQWPPRLREHGQHAAVVTQRLRREAVDAVRAGDRREVLEQQRRDALALVAVVHLERHLGVVTVVPPLVARPGDEVAVLLDDERGAVDEVDGGEPLELGLAQLGLGREVAVVAALGRLPQVERGERRSVGRGDRADHGGGAVAQHHGRGPPLGDVHGESLPRAGRRHRRGPA